MRSTARDELNSSPPHEDCRRGGGEDLYAGWWQLIKAPGAGPRVLVVWDGEDRLVGRQVRSLQDELGEGEVWVFSPADV